MDGRVVVLLYQLLRDQDRVLKVVPAPRHKGHQHVAAETKLALLRAWTVRNHLALDHPITLAHNRLLVDAGVLVGPLELGQLIDIRTNLTRQLRRMMLALHTHNNALGVDRINDAVALGKNHSARIASRNPFHTRSNKQRAVRIVMLKERNQRSRNRYHLLRRDVDVVDFALRHQHKVAGLTCIDQILSNVQVRIERNVGLRDRVPILFPRR